MNINNDPNNVQASHEDFRDTLMAFDPNGLMNNDSLVRSLGSIIQDELYLEDRTAEGSMMNMDTTSVQKTFPFKLYEILGDKNNESAIEWVGDGRLWRIVSVADMERHVLPKYFNHSKYQSFLRQVYRWGFKRYGSNKDCYFHEVRTSIIKERIREDWWSTKSRTKLSVSKQSQGHSNNFRTC